MLRILGAIASGITLMATLASCGDDLGPRTVDRLALIPDSAHLAPGQTSVHEIAVFDEDNRRLGSEWLAQIEWASPNPAIANVEIDGSQVRITANGEGTAVLWRELGSVRQSSYIWVHPSGLERIEIEPDPLIVGSGGTLWPVTHLYDVDGKEMDATRFRLSWRVADTTLATLGPSTNPSIRGNAVAEGSGGKHGTTRFYAVVSGRQQGFDLRVTLEPTPMEAPPVVETYSSSELRVSWIQDFEANDGYEVERAPSEGGPWTHLTFTGSAAWRPTFDTTHVDTGLTPSTTYHYRVRLCNEYGCSVEPSPVGAGMTGGGPG